MIDDIAQHQDVVLNNNKVFFDIVVNDALRGQMGRDGEEMGGDL